MAQLAGSGSHGDPFRAAGTDIDVVGGISRGGEPHSIIDLRPDSRVATGRCLLGLDERNDQPQRQYLGNDLSERSPAVRGLLQAALGVTIESSDLRSSIFELLTVHAREDRTRWRPIQPLRNLVYEVWLRGLVVRRGISGGATQTETFDGAASDTLGPNLTWTEVLGDWDKDGFNNAVLALQPGTSLARAEADVLTGDHVVTCLALRCNGSGSESSFNENGACGRFSTSAETYYLGVYRAGNSTKNHLTIAKVIEGSRTQLANTGPFSALDLIDLVLTIDGSSLDLVMSPQTVGPVTDMDITGNTRGGILGIVPASSGYSIIIPGWSIADLPTKDPGAFHASIFRPRLRGL